MNRPVTQQEKSYVREKKLLKLGNRLILCRQYVKNVLTDAGRAAEGRNRDP